MYAIDLNKLAATIPATWRSPKLEKSVGTTRNPIVNKLPTQNPESRLKTLWAIDGNIKRSEQPIFQLRGYRLELEPQLRRPLPC